MLEVDLTLAARFLDVLGGTPDPAAHTFQVFPEGASQAYPAVRHGLLAVLGDDLVRANRQGCGVSVTVNETDGAGRTFDNIIRPRALFLDLDGDGDDSEGRCHLPSFDVTPTAVVGTRRGYHVYWLLSDVPHWDIWERAQLMLAERFNGDPKMADRTKALRVPGLWHHKAEPPVAVELLSLEPHARGFLEDIAKGLRLDMTTPAPSSAPARTTNERPPWALKAIESMPQAERADQYRTWVDAQPPAIDGSGGHDQLVKVIKMAWNFGVHWPNAEDVVAAYNARCDPPWKDRALQSQFSAAGPRAEGRGRFDPTSWQSRLWAPEPAVVLREGVRPPDDVPPPESQNGANGRTTTVVRDQGPRPGPPPIGEPAPVPDAGGGGSAGGGGGTEDEGPGWAGPPVTGHLILDSASPMISAQMFVRWKYVSGKYKTLSLFRRAWYGWHGTRYESYSRERINRRLYTFAMPAQTWGKPNKKGARPLIPFNPNSSKVNDMRHALESLTLVDDDLVPPCWIGEAEEQPEPTEIVACKNGLLHLPTQRMLGPRPDFFNMTCLGVDYDPKAGKPKRWLRFLEQLWPDDGASHRLLQEWFGLCLVPDTSYQKALMIVGPRRSGKGTIARVLNSLHGEHNSVAWPSLTDLVSRFGMSALLDKTVAIMPDLRVSGRLDTQAAIERFLQITGEDRVQVDRKNLPMLQAKIPVRFLLLSNLPPKLPDAGGAFASRVLTLQLQESFLGKEDRFLVQALTKELPAILLWAMEGWARLRARGHFEQPETGRELLHELTALSNPTQTFVEERCELDDEYETYTDELFIQWRKWCEAEGRSAVGEKSTFVRSIKAGVPGLATVRRTVNGKRIYAIKGLRLRYEEPSDAPKQGEHPVF